MLGCRFDGNWLMPMTSWSRAVAGSEPSIQHRQAASKARKGKFQGLRVASVGRHLSHARARREPATDSPPRFHYTRGRRGPGMPEGGSMRRNRCAKIVATLGPTSSTKERIRALADAGADVFRFNFSHGSHADHAERFRLVRE